MAFFEPSRTFVNNGDDDKPKKKIDEKVKEKYNDLRYTQNSFVGKKAEKAKTKADKMKDMYDFSGVTYEGAGYIKNYN